ncbi:MAG TPA: hypothetical protein VFF95_08550 [Candidatus Binatus sp.]|jgi:hypothetical protein|nr:hypothetical protein [Candidatus Binatus sp.]
MAVFGASVSGEKFLFWLAWVLFDILFFGAQIGALVWMFRRWSRSKPRIGVPSWRSYVAICAFSLAAISSLLHLVLFAWARLIGGFWFYDPVVMRFYGWGFLTGAAGMVVSLAAKGKLRWPSFAFSAVMAVVWLLAAMSE